MTRFRVTLTAVLLAIGLSFTPTTSQADSPPTIDPHGRAIVAETSQPTDGVQDEPTPVPEPASMALFGIAISSYLTLRRFRKLFY
jgi:hypothetical protein